MPGVAEKGASLDDAIDLDAISGSDDEVSEVGSIWPPTRPSQINLPQIRSSYRDPARSPSDSPPIIVRSTFGGPSASITPSVGRGGRGRLRGSQRQSTTHSRLLAAVQPNVADDQSSGRLSSRAAALASAPSRPPPGPAVSSHRNNNHQPRPIRNLGQQILPFRPTSSHPPASVPPGTSNQNTLSNLPGAFPFTTSLPAGMPYQDPGYDALFRQVQQAIEQTSTPAASNTATSPNDSSYSAFRSAYDVTARAVAQAGAAAGKFAGLSIPSISNLQSNREASASGSSTPLWFAPPSGSYGPSMPSMFGGDINELVGDNDMLMEVLDPTHGYDEDHEPMDADMREILSTMVDGNFHGSDALATLYGDKGVNVAKLALYSDTESLRELGLKTSLHSHQLQGLLWMIKAEHRRVSKKDGTVRGLWQTRKDRHGKLFYMNLATRVCKRIPPTLPRGGINSDSMGLGKTIQIIATCLADRRRVPKGIKPVIKKVDAPSQSESQSQTEEENKAGPSEKAGKEEDEEEEDDEDDSEEEYLSETEAEEDSSDSSSCDDDEPDPKRVKESHRPTDSDGKAMKMKSESDSETEEDEMPVIRKQKARRAKQLAVQSDEEDEDEDDSKSAIKRVDGKKKRKEKRGTKKVKAKDGAKKKKSGAKGKGTSKSKTDDKEKVKYNESTLVICPLSVLQNWSGQVDLHCNRNKVKYYTYHGDSAKNVRKNKNFESFLSKFNFVFTTYDTIRSEYKVIERRQEAAMEKTRREEEKKKKEEEEEAEPSVKEQPKESSLSLTPSSVELERFGVGLRRENTSREGTSGSDVKIENGSEEDDKGKQVDKGKGKGKKRSRGDSKGKGKGRDWYDSDDSFIATDDDFDFFRSSKKKDDPREIPLFTVNWRRIVLDEAHVCRNPRTVQYNAICQLKGERRWAVTGTPIVNSTKDLGALAAWCGLQPFNTMPKEWSRVIERPLKKEHTSEQAASLLRKVVTSICLRRHKSMKNSQGNPIVKLPEIKYYKHTIPLTASDRDYYTKCELACRAHLARWIGQGDLNNHRSAILIFLLRLRQMSCHRRLIGNTLLEEIQNNDWDTIDRSKDANYISLTKEDIASLQEKLKVHVQMNDDCPICMEVLLGKEPMITPCGHPFCKACLSSIVNRGNFSNPPTCPMDRKPLPGLEKMIELPAETMVGGEEGEEEEYEEYNERMSAKVSTCLTIVRSTLRKDPTEKILIFSNFVKFLNIIGEDLKDSKISHARFNGELDVKRRDIVLKRFCTPIDARQSGSILRNMARLEEKLRKEREEQKVALEKKAEAESNRDADVAAPPSSEASVKTSSSSLLESLKSVDRDMNARLMASSSSKTKGKQKAQEGDVYGENPSVLLISMGCGALGLNLTVASTVLLMDPWWQSSAESQAIDRTHRIGQTRDVKVFQIISENTVEARVLEIQQTKEGLAETAFSGLRATGAVSDKREKLNTSMKDLVRLFGMSGAQVTTGSSRSVAGGSS